MRRLLPPIAALLALFAAPGHAADVGQLACPIDRLDAAQRAAVGEAAMRRSPPGPWREPLLNAIFDCGTRFRWRDDQERTAMIHSLSVLAERATSGALADKNVDFAALRRLVEGDTVFQDAFMTTSDEIGPLNAFLDRHRAAIERGAGRAFADRTATRILGDHLASLASAAWARRQFAAS